ncbi:FXSXX-COOH protein [Streptomyces montanus]|uniref:FXSXX-COOH protein n=2 Tax=Streptomyces montanus TaxID=2580423 RepID=A0A5R9FLE3_9ACTN|nr:FXSXX-COOH protein [Streptomyces montanus]
MAALRSGGMSVVSSRDAAARNRTAVHETPRPLGVDTMAVAEDAVLDEERGGGGDGPSPDVESVVLDIAALSPEQVAALPDSVLGALLRRVHDGCAEGDLFVTGHQESA